MLSLLSGADQPDSAHRPSAVFDETASRVKESKDSTVAYIGDVIGLSWRPEYAANTSQQRCITSHAASRGCAQEHGHQISLDRDRRPFWLAGRSAICVIARVVPLPSRYRLPAVTCRAITALGPGVRRVFYYQRNRSILHGTQHERNAAPSRAAEKVRARHTSFDRFSPYEMIRARSARTGSHAGHCAFTAVAKYPDSCQRQQRDSLQSCREAVRTTLCDPIGAT